MSMNRLIIKGGYGEHGRSCFLLSFGENRYYMLDCGIMDTDPNPFPQVEPALLKQTRYLFLSHCHKDHSGAFEEFCRQGFNGWLVTTRPTLEFSGILWDKTILLDCPSNPDQGRKSEVLPKSWTKVMRQSHFEFCIGQDLTHSIFL